MGAIIMLTLMSAIGAFHTSESMTYTLVGAGMGVVLVSAFFLLIYSLKLLIKNTRFDTPNEMKMMTATIIPLAIVFLLNISIIIFFKL